MLGLTADEPKGGESGFGAWRYWGLISDCDDTNQWFLFATISLGESPRVNLDGRDSRRV